MADMDWRESDDPFESLLEQIQQEYKIQPLTQENLSSSEDETENLEGDDTDKLNNDGAEFTRKDIIENQDPLNLYRYEQPELEKGQTFDSEVSQQSDLENNQNDFLNLYDSTRHKLFANFNDPCDNDQKSVSTQSETGNENSQDTHDSATVNGNVEKKRSADNDWLPSGSCTEAGTAGESSADDTQQSAISSSLPTPSEPTTDDDLRQTSSGLLSNNFSTSANHTGSDVRVDGLNSVVIKQEPVDDYLPETSDLNSESDIQNDFNDSENMNTISENGANFETFGNTGFVSAIPRNLLYSTVPTDEFEINVQSKTKDHSDTSDSNIPSAFSAKQRKKTKLNAETLTELLDTGANSDSSAMAKDYDWEIDDYEIPSQSDSEDDWSPSKKKAKKRKKSLNKQSKRAKVNTNPASNLLRSFTQPSQPKSASNLLLALTQNVSKSQEVGNSKLMEKESSYSDQELAAAIVKDNPTLSDLLLTDHRNKWDSRGLPRHNLARDASKPAPPTNLPNFRQTHPVLGSILQGENKYNVEDKNKSDGNSKREKEIAIKDDGNVLRNLLSAPPSRTVRQSDHILSVNKSNNLNKPNVPATSAVGAVGPAQMFNLKDLVESITVKELKTDSQASIPAQSTIRTHSELLKAIAKATQSKPAALNSSPVQGTPSGSHSQLLKKLAILSQKETSQEKAPFLSKTDVKEIWQMTAKEVKLTDETEKKDNQKPKTKVKKSNIVRYRSKRDGNYTIYKYRNGIQEAKEIMPEGELRSPGRKAKAKARESMSSVINELDSDDKTVEQIWNERREEEDAKREKEKKHNNRRSSYAPRGTHTKSWKKSAFPNIKYSDHDTGFDDLDYHIETNFDYDTEFNQDDNPFLKVKTEPVDYDEMVNTSNYEATETRECDQEKSAEDLHSNESDSFQLPVVVKAESVDPEYNKALGFQWSAEELTTDNNSVSDLQNTKRDEANDTSMTTDTPLDNQPAYPRQEESLNQSTCEEPVPSCHKPLSEDELLGESGFKVKAEPVWSAAAYGLPVTDEKAKDEGANLPSDYSEENTLANDKIAEKYTNLHQVLTETPVALFQNYASASDSDNGEKVDMHKKNRKSPPVQDNALKVVNALQRIEKQIAEKHGSSVVGDMQHAVVINSLKMTANQVLESAQELPNILGTRSDSPLERSTGKILEPEPEITIIKEERVDPSYGDVTTNQPSNTISGLLSQESPGAPRGPQNVKNSSTLVDLLTKRPPKENAYNKGTSSFSNLKNILNKAPVAIVPDKSTVETVCSVGSNISAIIRLMPFEQTDPVSTLAQQCHFCDLYSKPLTFKEALEVKQYAVFMLPHHYVRYLEYVHGSDQDLKLLLRSRALDIHNYANAKLPICNFHQDQVLRFHMKRVRCVLCGNTGGVPHGSKAHIQKIQKAVDRFGYTDLITCSPSTRICGFCFEAIIYGKPENAFNLRI